MKEIFTKYCIEIPKVPSYVTLPLIFLGFIVLFLLIGVSIVAYQPYCDALYFGTEELHAVSLPDLRNLSPSERYSLLAGNYELSSEYYLKMEKDEAEIISLCVLKRYFSKDSACLRIGTDVESVVICGPDMRPNCLPSAILEHFFGLSLWYQEESIVSYSILNIDTSGRSWRYLSNTTTTLSAVWYELIGECKIVVNMTIAVISFGVLFSICCVGCSTGCLRVCCLHCKDKR